jgi:hypothetical protein
MRFPMRSAAVAVAVAAAFAVAQSALAHETVTDHGVAVTMHVLPDDEPRAGAPSTIVIVSAKPPKGGRFTFKACTCRVKVTNARGDVLLNRRAGKRTPFVFPDPAAYEVTYSGTYRAKGGKTKHFSATFALRAS